jgi:hypothetical protein
MRRILENSRGLSLIEVVMGLGISTLVMLGVASVSSWVNDSYAQTVEENTAEQNLLLAAFYFKQFLGQAVETVCQSSPPTTLSSPTTLAVPFPNTIPPYIGQGLVNCNTVSPWPASAPGNPNALAIFNSEVGGVTSLAPGNYPASQFVGTGIYFYPPAGTQSGILYFAQGQPGSTLINLANAISIDHFVDVQVLQYVTSTVGTISTMTIRLTARYILQTTGTSPVSYLNAILVPPSFSMWISDLEIIGLDSVPPEPARAKDSMGVFITIAL